MSQKRTPISEVGEFGLIRKITSNLEINHKSSVKGVGDDAAVIGTGKVKTLVSSDLLMEGINFDLVYTPLKHLGYKAIVVSIADIYAMNGIPTQVTASIALSSKFTVESIEELYEGMKLACKKYKVDLVGGDTTSSMTGLVISMTAIGEVKENEICYRNTAEKTDLICVTGDLGGAYMGMQLLQREKRVFEESVDFQPDLSGYNYIVGRHLKPEIAAKALEGLRKENIVPTSMIDISDGLTSELFHICQQSDLGCAIYQEGLPIHDQTAKMAEEFHIDPITAALNGGEDYEILFTVPASLHNAIKDREDIHILGHMMPKENGKCLITNDGRTIELKAQGWEG